MFFSKHLKDRKLSKRFLNLFQSKQQQQMMAFRVKRLDNLLDMGFCTVGKQKQQNNKILLIRNTSNYSSFPPQIAYKLIE